MLKTRFGFQKVGWMPLLLSVLLIGALGISTAYAAGAGVTFLKGDTTYIPLQHTKTTYGDSAKYKLANITVVETVAGNLIATATDSVQIKPPANYTFVTDSVVTITASPVGGLKIDTTGFAALGIVQTSQTTVKLKMKNYISFMISTVSSGTADTLTISGLYLQSAQTAANFDSTTAAYIAFSQKGIGANSANLSKLIALPGAYNKIAMIQDPAGEYYAGENDITAIIKLEDAAGNAVVSGSVIPNVKAVLNGTSTQGNGTLSGTTTVTRSDRKDSVTYTAMAYTKAENIQLVFTAPGNTLTSGELHIYPGDPANISVSLLSGKDTLTVDQTVSYTLTVTDQYYNPVLDDWIIDANEATPHGAVISLSGETGQSPFTSLSGQLSATFAPSKYFVGLDTIVFTSSSYDGKVTKSHNLKSPTIKISGATQLQPVLITHGAIGGIIVDYSNDVNNATVTEAIGAGKQIYARAFLRDTYGNPIDFTSPAASTFTISGKLGKSTSLGTPGLTNAIVESGYPNTVKTAVGIAIPYTISTNVRAEVKENNIKSNGKAPKVLTSTLLPDSILVASNGYNLTLTIQNRSDIPAKLSATATTGDSSLVASLYATSLTVTDTVWDQYGNLCNDPGAVKVSPLESAYDIFASTSGFAKFVRAKDTTAADTLLPSAGVVTRTVSPSTVSGADNVVLVAASSSSLTKSTPIWVTPAAFAKIAITPKKDTTAIAGQTVTFNVEKQDQYGNHIDLGLAGGNLRGHLPSTTKPDSASVAADSAALSADTVSTGSNRGGVVTISKRATAGKAGVASVGGTLVATFPFTTYVAGADTQKVYATIGAYSDTALVRSAATGSLSSFKIEIAAADSIHHAGDVVTITVTAQDAASNRIYTYISGGQKLVLNHTGVKAITTADSTFYFTYIRNHKGVVKAGDTLTVNGNSIPDTVFVQGQAKFSLHKFTAEDSINTVSISTVGGAFKATSASGVKFLPLSAIGQYGKWAVTINTDSVTTKSPNVSFTVIPRDKYYNVTTKDTVIVNITTSLSSGILNFGSNPKVIVGPTTITGPLTNAKGNPTLQVSVFTSDNSHLYAASAIKSLVVVGVENPQELPKSFALNQNYPNPFNPSTVISYDLPVKGDVTLKIYDVLGREVATLVNEKQNAGSYKVTFNASKLSSGVYFYQLQAGSFSSVKKLILMK